MAGRARGVAARPAQHLHRDPFDVAPPHHPAARLGGPDLPARRRNSARVPDDVPRRASR